MATQPPTRCTEPGCPRTSTRRGRCDEHARAPRPSAHTRALLSDPRTVRAWRAARGAVLARTPLCARCGAPATEVDHVVPVADGGALLDPDNLQPLCAGCHRVKTALDERARRAGSVRRAKGGGRRRQARPPRDATWTA